MAATQPIYLSDSELQSLKDSLAEAFAYKSGKYFKFLTYGSIKAETLDKISKQILLYILCLQEWNQHSDGTTTGLFNYITRLEFSNLVNQSRKIIAYNG